MRNRQLLFFPLLLTLLCPGVWAQAITRASRDRAEKVVVLVWCMGNGSTANQAGAGIIVGTQGKRLYVVTASHILVNSCSTQEYAVELRSPVGERLSASRVRSDPDLDVDVLSAEARSNADLPSLDLLGNSKHLQPRSSSVYVLGHPNKQFWHLTSSPQIVIDSGLRIVFESAVVQPGDSGGALLDKEGQLVGMVNRTSQPVVIATSIETIRERLQQWRIAWGLTEPLSSAPIVIPVHPPPAAPKPFEFQFDNVIYQVPEGWTRTQSDAGVVLSPANLGPEQVRLELGPSKRLLGRFEDAFDQSLQAPDCQTTEEVRKRLNVRGVRFLIAKVRLRCSAGGIPKLVLQAVANPGDRFEEITLWNPYGYDQDQLASTFISFLNSMDFANIRKK